MTENKERIDWLNAKILQKIIITDEVGNLLITKRSTSKPGARQGKWDFLGGSMNAEDLQEKGEPHELALAREAREESGLEVKDIAPICVRSGKKLTQTAGEVLVYAVGFTCKVDGVKPAVTLSDEHTEYNWVTHQEVQTVDFGEDEEGFHRQTLKAFMKSLKR